ncbi:hypothetical protein AB1Y20_019688 [Prymnesium parvum]|uniref:Calponin-homology (CH) domain-containing protein n=1 Tax=Prymnesium parvum TaxID=97485 RepID=A0AB34JRT5_PRYPA
MAVASRKELQRWTAEVTGQRISCLENQCRTGAIYCQLVDAARPGSVDMRKVNLKADDNNALVNYKALEAALSKLGIEETRSMDIQKLAAGQPQATLELLQTLHAALVADEPAETPRGGRLATLDPNALEAELSSRKRKAALPTQGVRPQRRARAAGTVEEQITSAEDAPASPQVAADTTATEAAETSRNTSMIQDELEHTRAQLAKSRVEALHLRAEADFYYRKLERIEDVCSCGTPSKVPAAVLSILQEHEEEAVATC